MPLGATVKGDILRQGQWLLQALWSWEMLSPPSRPLSGPPRVSPVSSGPGSWAEPEPGPLLGPLDTSLFLLPFSEPESHSLWSCSSETGLRNWVVRAQEGHSYV